MTGPQTERKNISLKETENVFAHDFGKLFPNSEIQQQYICDNNDTAFESSLCPWHDSLTGSQ